MMTQRSNAKEKAAAHSAAAFWRNLLCAAPRACGQRVNEGTEGGVFDDAFSAFDVAGEILKPRSTSRVVVEQVHVHSVEE